MKNIKLIELKLNGEFCGHVGGKIGREELYLSWLEYMEKHDWEDFYASSEAFADWHNANNQNKIEVINLQYLNVSE